MELYISDQCLQFLLCALLGAIAGGMYEFPRIIRKWKRHPFVFVIIEDILYCILFAFTFICVSYSLSDGIVRWYYYAGAAIGFFIYQLSLGRLIGRITPRIVSSLDQSIAFIGRFCIHPIAKSVNTVIIFLKKLAFPLFVKKKKRKITTASVSSETARYF